MKRVNIILMMFGAIFAFSAAIASSASAGVLFETQEGNFPVSYSGVSKEVPRIETTGGNTIECHETQVNGEIGNMGTEVGTKFAHLFLAKILFRECKNTILGGGPCENRGAGTKEIELGTLVGHLGLTHSATNLHIPAVLLLPGGAEYECTILGVKGKIETTGNIIGEIEKPEIGIFKHTLSLNFKKSARGVQEYKLFLLQLVPEAESIMENEHLTTEELGKVEEASIEEKITLTSTGGLGLVEI